MSQFQTSYDECGNLMVRSGWIIEKGGSSIHVGPQGFPLSESLELEILAGESDGVIYLGGSGRNLIVTGMPEATYNGPWRHGYPNKWDNEEFTLVHVPGGATTITDGTADLAVLASGGPVGSLVSTPYGDTYFGASFVAVVSAEWTAPGQVPKAFIESGASGLNSGEFTALDAANYVSDLDPLLGIEIAENGVAHLIHDGVVIAIREDGPNDNPFGEYESTEDGLIWNPTTPEDNDSPAVEVNPFGVLTLVYSWPATPDLDTTTKLLGEQVGFPGPYSTAHMTHSGDDQSPSGSETVAINLFQAFADGVIGDNADITCCADWYPGGVSGTATLDVTYTKPGFTPMSLAIRPGNIKPGAKTVVAAFRVNADGTITQNFEPWTAEVSRIPVPPVLGEVYLTEVEVAGNLSSVAGPFFAFSKPADTATDFHIPLAKSNGSGAVETLWTGMILRR